MTTLHIIIILRSGHIDDRLSRRTGVVRKDEFANSSNGGCKGLIGECCHKQEEEEEEEE
jgi:hypothetical protein